MRQFNKMRITMIEQANKKVIDDDFIQIRTTQKFAQVHLLIK